MARLLSARLQSGIFIAAALAAVLDQYFIHRSLDGRIGLAPVAVFVALLGVPHGALDFVYAKQLAQIKKASTWALFVFAYLCLAALVVIFWKFASAPFLLTFLVMSAFHFSGDLTQPAYWASRLFYGGAIIVLPTFFYSVEVTRLFAYLAEEHFANDVVTALRLLAAPWLVGLLCVIVGQWRSNKAASREMFALGLIALVLPPLEAFVLYFCAMHGPRHIQRTIQKLNIRSMKVFFSALILPTVAVVSASFVLWSLLPQVSIDARMTQLIFVQLAALTFPHMFLVERSRFS